MKNSFVLNHPSGLPTIALVRQRDTLLGFRIHIISDQILIMEDSEKN